MKKFILIYIFLIFASFSFAEVSVTPYGAAGVVSGSNFLYEAADKKILIDCGIFMAGEGDNLFFPPEVLNADALILTHAHLDHAGRTPLLLDKGFKGNIYSTPATKEIVLNLIANRSGLDLISRRWYWSANQAQKAKDFGNTVVIHWTDGCASGIKNIEYSESEMLSADICAKENIKFVLCKDCSKIEADKIAKRFVTVEYSSPVAIFENITFELLNAAHIPGSASVLISAENKKVLFSGDLGSGFSRLTGTFNPPSEADVIFMESTYANDSQELNFESYEKFQKDLAKAISKNKIVWIPALALNRTQKILYELNLMQKNGTLSKDVPIYSVSPSANAATNLYKKEIENKTGNWFLPEVYENGLLPAGAKLQPVRNYDKQMVLISASGDMSLGMSAGIVNKLIPKKDVFIMIVNYVRPDSNAGRLLAGKPLQDGIKSKAEIKKYDIFSDHPGFEAVKYWLSNQSKSAGVYLIHCEKSTAQNMKTLLEKEGRTNIFIPEQGQKIICD
ncbi:MBL fold metallo-hydrolase [Endomicrobium proavitum]|uniref:RNA-metabolising metallo-beta-lactamase n=1 Tax=Endomicrobium proavitum TaxID=1408281 RepID=A0A0G3WI82_9BACT|nr:MBL fold metallo-hydrolase [Endomicrobium proavitum]AKL98396.1 RNA-metabolising metallo-beta-lactamase [Endomicrobium proavitum]